MKICTICDSEMNQMSKGWNTKDGSWIRYICLNCDDRIEIEYVDTKEVQIEMNWKSKEE